MGAFIAKQPNGRYCRHSTVVDCITDYNMTELEYAKMCMEKALWEADDTLKRYLHPFEMVKESFYPNNMTRKEFNKILKEMEQPITD